MWIFYKFQRILFILKFSNPAVLQFCTKKSVNKMIKIDAQSMIWSMICRFFRTILVKTANKTLSFIDRGFSEKSREHIDSYLKVFNWFGVFQSFMGIPIFEVVLIKALISWFSENLAFGLKTAPLPIFQSKL